MRAQSKNSKKLRGPAGDMLPDVAMKTDADSYTRLDWVGMDKIELPIRIHHMQVPAKVSAQVSLDLQAVRGIHMSRLYRLVQEKIANQQMDVEKVSELLNDFLASHAELSSAARIRLQFPFFIQRKALVTDNRGWRQYPVEIFGEKTPRGTRIFYKLRVTYSSTCPASAALSRQANADAYLSHFADQSMSSSEVSKWLKAESGMPATPHAQRSRATITVELSDFKKNKKTHDSETVDFDRLIDLVESVLKTPVQTVVKREDEQAFAVQNGHNLMFCEDAARRIQRALGSFKEIKSFRGEVRHMESLHPHDAVCSFSSLN